MNIPPYLGALVLAPFLTVAPGPDHAGSDDAGTPDIRLAEASVAPRPLGAGDRACVTRAEYEAIRVGMSLRRVGRIFGTPGYAFTGTRYVRTYPACLRGDSVTVAFVETKRRGLVVRGKRWNAR